MFKNFFKIKEKENSNEKNILIIALLIHAAKIDENYTGIEKKIIKMAIMELNQIDEDEAEKEFHFKKIYMEMEKMTLFCYTDGDKEKSYFKFEDLERYDFIIYIKDVWVLCNFKTRLNDGEQQYRIIRKAICNWTLSNGGIRLAEEWILNDNNDCVFIRYINTYSQKDLLNMKKN